MPKIAGKTQRKPKKQVRKPEKHHKYLKKTTNAKVGHS
jgi:hypothetical protein